MLTPWLDILPQTPHFSQQSKVFFMYPVGMSLGA